MYWNRKHKPGAAERTPSGACVSPAAEKFEADPAALGVGSVNSLQDLQGLLRQYGPLLTKENRALLEEAVGLLSQNGSNEALQALTEKFRSAYMKQDF